MMIDVVASNIGCAILVATAVPPDFHGVATDMCSGVFRLFYDVGSCGGVGLNLLKLNPLAQAT